MSGESTKAIAGLDAEQDIELVVAFLNTVDAETGTDVLHDAESWRRWCADRNLGAPPEADAAREIRDRMRAAVTHGTEPVDATTADWPMRIRLRSGVPVLAGVDAVGAVLASAVHLVHAHHWDRLKICPADDCLWAFYDRSRNRSRTWCAMKVCGNREKARSWRERHLTR